MPWPPLHMEVEVNWRFSVVAQVHLRSSSSTHSFYCYILCSTTQIQKQWCARVSLLAHETGLLNVQLHWQLEIGHCGWFYHHLLLWKLGNTTNQALLLHESVVKHLSTHHWVRSVWNVTCTLKIAYQYLSFGWCHFHCTKSNP